MYSNDAHQFDESLQKEADDIMAVARELALHEFEEEWGKP